MVQLFSRSAVLKFDGVAIAYLKNVTMNIDNTIVKEYDDAGEPDVLEYGDVSYTFTAEEGYADSTEIDKVLTKAKFDMILYPDTAAAGKDKFTLASCIVSFQMSWTRNAVVLSRISGEGKSVVKGVAP